MHNESQNHNQDSGFDDKYVDRLVASIRQPKIDNARIKSLVQEKMAMQRRAAFRRRVYVSLFSAAAVVALIFGVGFLLNVDRHVNLREATASALQEAGYLEVKVPRGERMEIDLPDGSHLIANYNSKVVYPEKFTGKERRIYVNGQVYIEVAKDKNHPFIVESEGFDVKVLGTVFNIDNVNATNANIVLLEGSINLTTSNNQNVILKPNELAEVQDGGITALRQVDPEDYTSWIKGLITLKGETMSTLSRRLSDYYGVKVVCDPSISETKVYGKLDLRDSIEDVLTSVKEIVPMKIDKSDKTITLKKGN